MLNLCHKKNGICLQYEPPKYVIILSKSPPAMEDGTKNLYASNVGLVSGQQTWNFQHWTQRNISWLQDE